MEGRLVRNAADVDGKSLAIVTGANQGGKSSFLRSIGLAQMMMQCGMFVGAESFQAELCSALFTHYKREEDVTMKSGKLDEELVRISAIVDHIMPNSLLLLNESFELSRWRGGRCACDTSTIMCCQGIPSRKPVSSNNSIAPNRLQVRVNSIPIA